MTGRLLVSTRSGAQRLALWADDRLAEYTVERAANEGRPGDIYLGRVTGVDKGLDAAFVDIGLARPGFLPLGESGERPTDGAAVVVQVTRGAQGDKGARLSARPVLAGRLLELDPHRPGVRLSERVERTPEWQRLADLVRRVARPGEGFVLRRAAAGSGSEALAAEADRLRAAWAGVLARRAAAKPPARLHDDGNAVVRLLRDQAGAPPAEIVFDARAAAAAAQRSLAAVAPDLAGRVVYRPARDWMPGEAEIADEVAAALEPRAPLPSGGWLLFEPGETLTAIDVNTGTAPGQGAERTLLQCNLEAAAEIAHQLRLRNIGGIVVVDFVDLKSKDHRRQVVEALGRAVAADPCACSVGSMSRLGLVEMTRRRRGPSLAAQLTRACPACGGVGRIAGPATGDRSGGRA